MALAQPSGRQETAAPAIELRGISKAFGPVQANKDISIRVMPGTIHGIIGENGAGKSTLMSILYGFYRADAGEIFIGGKPTIIHDSQAAIRAGIGMVFQHFKLVQNFTVLENVILGVEEGMLLRPSLAKARTALTRSCQGICAGGRPRRADRRAFGRAVAAGRDSQGALSPRRGADSGRADRGADPGRGRPSVSHPAQPARAGQDDHPDHPQAARDHGDHRYRFGDAPRRDDRNGQDQPRPAPRRWPN